MVMIINLLLMVTFSFLMMMMVRIVMFVFRCMAVSMMLLIGLKCIMLLRFDKFAFILFLYMQCFYFE